jgi:hypothetical protein
MMKEDDWGGVAAQPRREALALDAHPGSATGFAVADSDALPAPQLAADVHESPARVRVCAPLDERFLALHRGDELI